LAADYAEWTPYHYVHNNPIMLTDPTGMKADSTYHFNTNTGVQTTLNDRGGTDTDYYIIDNGLPMVHNDYVGTTYEVDNTPAELTLPTEATGAITSTDNPIEMLLEAPKTASLGLLALVRGVIKSKADNAANALVRQADELAEQVGKNTVTVTTPKGKIHYDLRGAPHKGVPTPHVQKSVRNVNPTTGASYYNKNRKYVKGMTQDDIRTIKNYLKRKK